MWDSVTDVQSSTTTVVKSVAVSGKKYVYFDVQPNKGQITLSVGGQTAVSPGDLSNSRAVSKSQEQMACPNPITAKVFSQYLQVKKNLMVCDLTGKIIAKNVLIHPGVYLAERWGAGAMQKVLVIQ